jgi:hypothetical protein
VHRPLLCTVNFCNISSGTLFKCRIADSTGEMGAIFYDEVGVALKVGDVLQLKEGVSHRRPPPHHHHHHLLLLLSTMLPRKPPHFLTPFISGYTMNFTNMGHTSLFLYKGREGSLQKIDEVNMQVPPPPSPLPPRASFFTNPFLLSLYPPPQLAFCPHAFCSCMAAAWSQTHAWKDPS